MTAAIIETKRIDGKPAHRVEGSPPGCWTVANTEIDAMLNRVQLELGVKRSEVLRATRIQQACVYRCRQGLYGGVPDHWLKRLTEYSGIPAAELCRVACIDHVVQSVVQPHLRARRST